jgi:hypothetical protein
VTFFELLEELIEKSNDELDKGLSSAGFAGD